MSYPDDPYLDVFRRGNLVVSLKNVAFPPHCIKCGVHCHNSPIKRTLYWHPAWLYILVLPALLIYAIVALAVRKTGTIYIHICDEHRRRRTARIALGWFIGIALLVVGFSGFCMENPYIIIFGFLGSLITAIVFVIITPLVAIDHIDDQYVYLKKMPPAFLNLLPDDLGHAPDYSTAFPVEPPPPAPPRRGPPPPPR